MQMTCPKCQGQLRQYERSGVTVDQCTECRGVFLDRGELERLIDAENTWLDARRAPAPAQHQPQPQRPYRDYDSDEYPMYRGEASQHGRRKKHRGFLEELFD